VAHCADDTSRALARQYRVIGPALFHNFLVNSGIRRRGLCFQWTEDLLVPLEALQLKSLELHWAVARPGTLREHNCVVVAARGQPFAQGVVLDAWRHAGRLYWGPVATDHYPWRKDDSEYVRQRALRKKGATHRSSRNKSPRPGAGISR